VAFSRVHSIRNEPNESKTPKIKSIFAHCALDLVKNSPFPVEKASFKTHKKQLQKILKKRLHQNNKICYNRKRAYKGAKKINILG